MSSHTSPERVVDLLTRLMNLSVRTSALGPLEVDGEVDTPTRGTGHAGGRAAGQPHRPQRVALPGMPRGVALRGRGRLVGVVTPQLAQWSVEGPRALRLAVEALSRECSAHWPSGGRCRECDTPAPCRAWNRLTSLLVRDETSHAAQLGTEPPAVDQSADPADSRGRQPKP